MADKFRVAVIGRTGRGDYGHGIDTVWADVPEAQLVAVADDDKVGLAAAVTRLNAEQGFSDYREMLDKAKPDIVSICPRWVDQHHDMVLAAAERGIHMFLEKPLCRTLAEADAMVTACERTHARLVIAHQTRYSPMLPVIQEMISSGKLGRVLEFRARGKEDHRGGSEDLWVLGTHLMDLMRALGGQPQWCMASVTQAGRPIQKSDVVEGNEGLGPLAGDAVSAMYGMPEGATAYFASSRQAAGRPSRFGLMIYGSAGVLEVLTNYLPAVHYLPDPGWSPGRSGAAWQNVSSAGVGKPEPLENGGPHAGNLAAVNDLIAAIRENREPRGGILEARAATEMIVAAFESQRLGGRVDLPMKNRENPLTMLA